MGRSRQFDIMAALTTLPLPRAIAWRRFPGRLLDLGPPRARTAALLLLLAIAIVSPDISLPAGLPAIRLEQVLLLVLIPSLLRYHVAHRDARRVGIVDAVFLGLGLAIGLSIVFAPLLVPQVSRSTRDVFQLLRPLDYWLLYRLARIAPVDRPTTNGLLLVLGLAGLAGGLFAVLQVVGGQGFNEAVTSIWTGPGHNLAGVIENGRAVGTVGNANLFGLLQGWFALATFAALLLPVIGQARWTRAAALALALATAGLVVSQSRSASLSIAGAALVGMLFLIGSRARGRLVLAWAPILAGVAIALATIAVAASAQGFAGRFTVGSLGSDASVIERLAILRYAFAARDAGAERRLICEGDPTGTVRAGHEPVGPANPGDTRAPAAAVAAALIERTYCATGSWPTDATALGLPASAPYRLQLGPDGYEVSQPVPPSDRDAPLYALTSHPNLLLDPSFDGATGSSGWLTSSGSSLSSVSPGRFGRSAARIWLAPGGYLDQYVLYTFAPGTGYTASIWARGTAGGPRIIRFQLEAWLTGGDRIAPIGRAEAELPADGGWVRLSTAFRTPQEDQIWVIRAIVSASDPASTGTVELDGAELTQGSTSPNFAYVRDVDPATLPSTVPSFRQSPLIGVGPMSNIEVGSFDNEYVLVLVRFGVIGLAAYVLLFLSAGITALVSWRRRVGIEVGAISFALGLAILATAVYNIAAGTYYSYQVMAVLWLWVGWVSVARHSPRDGIEGPGGSR